LSDDGLFTTSTTNGGSTWITASAGGMSATADVLVIYEEIVTEEGVPEGAEAAFEQSTAPSEGLEFAYPEDGVALPRNLQSPAFMWWDTDGMNLYRLEFSSDTTQVVVYTNSREWTVPDELWRTITATNAGGSVQLTLSGAAVTTVDGAIVSVDAVLSGPSIEFIVNRLDAEGAIYYFSTTESGIVRCDVEDTEPVPWFSQSSGNTEGSCVGCHEINPQGDRMAYAWNEDDIDRQGLASITENGEVDLVLTHTSGRDKAYFSTYDPSGAYMVISSESDLFVYDGQTGELLHEISSDIDLTMPDWSPDGTMLVAISGRNMNSDVNFSNGYLVILEHLGEGQFSEPWPLTEAVPQGQDGNSYYPVFSPDSRWVAYNKTEGWATNFADDASLWLVEAMEGAQPIELARANRAQGITNSWPRWGPVPDDDVYWLTFASDRDYGIYQSEHAQIWISGVDTRLADQGQDPSMPAYRLPQQGWDDSNHAPVWSLY
jgi:dipeptidyl aminopeptidase/acylaminoacyl peptidase